MIRVEAHGPDGQLIAAELTPGPERKPIQRSRWSDDTGETTVEQADLWRSANPQVGEYVVTSDLWAAMKSAAFTELARGRGGFVRVDVTNQARWSA